MSKRYHIQRKRKRSEKDVDEFSAIMAVNQTEMEKERKRGPMGDEAYKRGVQEDEGYVAMEVEEKDRMRKKRRKGSTKKKDEEQSKLEAMEKAHKQETNKHRWEEAQFQKTQTHKETYSIPVKTLDGEITQRSVVLPSQNDMVQLKTKFDKVREARAKEEKDARQMEDVMEDDEALKEREKEAEATKHLDAKERHAMMEQKIASMSMDIIANPTSRYMRKLGDLIHMAMNDRDVLIQKKALMSLNILFQDLAPSYRINISQYDNNAQTLSREIEELKNYEFNLIKQYQAFLQLLDFRIQKGKREPTLNVCIQCLADQLRKNHHFNFAENIAELCVPLLNKKNAAIRTVVMKAVCAVFKEDKSFEITNTMVEMLARFIKSKNYRVRVEMIDCFLYIPLTAILKDKLIPKEITTFKRFNKRRSTQKKKFTLSVESQLMKDMREFKAEHTTTHLFKMQTNILRNMIVTYVRLLKSDPFSPLLFASLAGLGKFSHLINVELIYDLLHYMRNLLALHDEKVKQASASLAALDDSRSELPLKTSLQLIITAHALQRGLGSTINIDMHSIYYQLYHNLPEAVGSNDDLLYKLLVQGLFELLLDSATSQPPDRLGAFIKRISTLLQLAPTHLQVVMLQILFECFKKHSSLLQLLTGEESGIGMYDPHTDNPDGANSLSTTLWEISALYSRTHHAHVKLLIQKIMQLVVPVTSHAKNTHEHFETTTTIQKALFNSKMTSLSDLDSMLRVYTPYRGHFYPEVPLKHYGYYDQKLAATEKRNQKQHVDLQVFIQPTDAAILRSSPFFKNCFQALQQNCPAEQQPLV